MTYFLLHQLQLFQKPINSAQLGPNYFLTVYRPFSLQLPASSDTLSPFHSVEYAPADSCYELGWSRKKAAAVIGIIMVLLGSLSALGYGPLSGVTVIGMQFLDFFDFLTNSVMMPIAAIATCLLVTSVIGVEKIEEEVTQNGQPFRRKKVFNFMIRTLCPVFAAIILVSSVANALGWISM